MRNVFRHLKTYIFRGFLAIIPLILSFFVIQFLYLTIDRRVTGIVERIVGFRIPGLGIFLVLILLYLLGLAASNWVGKKIFNFIEQITARIPLIKTIYKLGKQLGEAFSLPERQVFKRAVMVEQFRPGVWSIGFVAGQVIDKGAKGEKLLKVFIPTTPNPTTGFMVMVRESQVRNLEWTITEAMNSILSGGIIGPEKIE